jgi:hypothetical protein
MKRVFVFHRIPQARLPAWLIHRDIWVIYWHRKTLDEKFRFDGREATLCVPSKAQSGLTFCFLAPPTNVVSDYWLKRCKESVEKLMGCIAEDDPEFTVTG